MPSSQHGVPEGLEELIKNGISAAYPESSNAAGSIKVTTSKIDNVDYQFHIGRLVSCLRKNANDIIVQIRTNISHNDTIERLELERLENGPYINIFTKIKRPKPCKTCSNKTKLGKQQLSTNIAQNSLDLLTTEFLRRILKYNQGNKRVVVVIINKSRRETFLWNRI